MFLYGIFKSFLLHKVLKNMYTYDVSKDFVILNWEYENKHNFLMNLLTLKSITYFLICVIK